MKKLSKDEMKQVVGGVAVANYCGSTDLGGCCNVYCGTGTNVTCSGNYGTCADAGNGSGTGAGQDKLCIR